MGRAKETFGKKEVRNKQMKKRQEKEKRKLEKKEQDKTSFEDMIAWVDADGNPCSEPPEANAASEIEVEDIEISVPKGGNKPKDEMLTGKVNNYEESKGYGFISSSQLDNSVFFHVNDCDFEIKVGDKVEFKIEKGPKGLKAHSINKVSQ